MDAHPVVGPERHRAEGEGARIVGMVRDQREEREQGRREAQDGEDLSRERQPLRLLGLDG